MKRLLPLLFTSLSLVAAGCDAEPPVPTRSAQEQRRPLTGEQQQDAKEVAQGNNQFALDLFAQLRRQPGNMFFSPYSISSALAMALAGARGETANQMQDVTYLKLESARLHPAFYALQSGLISQQQGLELHIANRLWGQQGSNFVPEFLRITRDDYGAELGQVDFIGKTEAARQTINAWVQGETRDRIKDLLPQGVLDQDSRLVLTNAIYFNGEWKSKFNPNSTHTAAFHLSANKQIETKFMNHDTHLRYGEAEGLKVLELPYKGDRQSMWVLLPSEIEGLDALEAQLTNDQLTSWLESAQPKQVIVQLPKFTLSSEFRLADTLKALGMTDAFDPNAADFSGLNADERLYVTAVIHKAFVAVNEKGTEAAAATGLALGAASAVADPPKIFNANHPFLYLIRDNATGSILFLGRLANPE